MTVFPNDRADFRLSRPGGGGWSCFNVRGRFVRCNTGDAYPYVVVGSALHRVNVKVYMPERGGRVTRKYESGNPVYVFTDR